MRLAVNAGKLSTEQDLPVTLQTHIIDRAVGGERKARIDRAITRQPGDAVARLVVNAGEQAAHYDLIIRLDRQSENSVVNRDVETIRCAVRVHAKQRSEVTAVDNFSIRLELDLVDDAGR